MEQELVTRLNEAWTNSANKNVVAFIGRVKSGKTVATALLKHTLTEFWDPQTTGIHGSVIKGNDRLNKILDGMRSGDYPGVTPETTKPEIRIRLRNINGNVDDWIIVINDMSGEDVVELLSTDRYHSPEARLAKILEANMQHLLFASKYVITVDCERRDAWSRDGEKVASAVNNLVELKNILPNEYSTDFSAAIVFTKTDTLPPNQKDLPASEILGMYRELLLNLRMNKIKYVAFKSHLKTTRPRKNGKAAPDNDTNNDKTEAWRTQMEAAITSEIESEENNARSSGAAESEIAKIPDAVRSRVEKQFSEQITEDLGDSPDSKKPKIKYPFDYSDAQYTDLISWLVNSDGGDPI